MPASNKSRRPWSSEVGLLLPGAFMAPECPIRAPTPDDIRLAHVVGSALTRNQVPACAVIGFPTDEGVRRNCGRVGARDAPDRIRQFLYRLTPAGEPGFAELLAHTHDYGNLRTDDDLEAAQERLGASVAACLAHDVVPIVLGGGHETAFGHFLGYAHAERDVSILNWDAHTDVRPLLNGLGHSGSPFRQALLHASRRCVGYTVAGLLPHAVAQSQLEFVEEHGARHLWRREITPEQIAQLYAYESTASGTRSPQPEARSRTSTAQSPKSKAQSPDLMVSFDVDALDQSIAPGVSAPATGGLTLDLWLEAAWQTGRSPRVRSIDIVEVNPRYDEDDQTSRVAALTIWTLLRGIAGRRGASPAAGERSG